MASRRLTTTATSSDLLADEEIRDVDVPSIVNMWAASVTESDELALRLGKTVIMDTGRCNQEAASGVVDTNRDQLVFNTVVGRGKLRMPVSTLTTELSALVSVEPIL